MLLFVLIKFSHHHFVKRAWLIVSLGRKVFKEQKLLLLVHADLLARSRGVHLLGELVLGGDGLPELGQRVVILHVEAVPFPGVVPHFPLFCKARMGVKADNSQIAVRVGASADLLEETKKRVGR